MNVNINDTVYNIKDISRIPLISTISNINYDIKIDTVNDNISFNIDFSDSCVRDYIDIINNYNIVDDTVHNISISDDVLNLMSYMGHDVDDILYLYDKEYRYDLLFPRWKMISNSKFYFMNIDIFIPFNLFLYEYTYDDSDRELFFTDYNMLQKMLNTLSDNIEKSKYHEDRYVICHHHKEYLINMKIFKDVEEILIYIFGTSNTISSMERLYDINNKKEYRINLQRSDADIIDYRKLSHKYAINILYHSNKIILPNIDVDEDVKDYIMERYNEYNDKDIMSYVSDYNEDDDYYETEVEFNEYEKDLISLCDRLGIQYDRDSLNIQSLPNLVSEHLNIMKSDRFIEDIEHFMRTYTHIDCLMLIKLIRASRDLSVIQILFYYHRFKLSRIPTLLKIKQMYNIYCPSYIEDES